MNFAVQRLLLYPIKGNVWNINKIMVCHYKMTSYYQVISDKMKQLDGDLNTFDIHPKWRKSYLLWLVENCVRLSMPKLVLWGTDWDSDFWSGRQTLVPVSRKRNINAHCCNSDSCQISCPVKWDIKRQDTLLITSIVDDVPSMPSNESIHYGKL